MLIIPNALSAGMKGLFKINMIFARNSNAMIVTCTLFVNSVWGCNSKKWTNTHGSRWCFGVCYFVTVVTSTVTNTNSLGVFSLSNAQIQLIMSCVHVQNLWILSKDDEGIVDLSNKKQNGIDLHDLSFNFSFSGISLTLFAGRVQYFIIQYTCLEFCVCMFVCLRLCECELRETEKRLNSCQTHFTQWKLNEFRKSLQSIFTLFGSFLRFFSP